VAEQYASLFAFLREPARREKLFLPDYGDSYFLGTQVTALPARREGTPQYVYDSNLPVEERRPLREALRACFHSLPVSVFHRYDDFVAHAVFGPHNPLLLGRRPEEVTVRVGGRLLAPLEEQREEAARHLLGQLTEGRLIPLGCLQAGQDAGGRLLIARRPRLDEYFGHAAAEGEQAAPGPEGSRVVVQPDFSVVLIGLDPAPAAELAPFCERLKGRPGQGAVTYRITRDAVVRAVAAGLTGEEMLARLERHSSTPLPGNVAHEVRDWCAWVREVRAEGVVLLRCPGAAAAERARGVLGRQAERLNETTLAVASALTAAQRKKLQEHGILVVACRPAPDHR
jgi:hypothetical protein